MKAVEPFFQRHPANPLLAFNTSIEAQARVEEGGRSSTVEDYLLPPIP
ncbi:hypothetical protein A2U01_0079973, partial [Trifolium medium]|nr:hypothetical protein [Trifolium medium]